MKNKLLEKAKNYHGKSGELLPNDLVELALEWIKGAISNKQFRFAIGDEHGAQTYVSAARALRQAFKQGRLVVKK